VGGWGSGGHGCVSVYIGKQKIKKLTLNSFLVVLSGQSSTPTELSSKVVRGEGMGRGVVVVVVQGWLWLWLWGGWGCGCGAVMVMGWTSCSVDTAKMTKNSPNYFFALFFFCSPHTYPIVNKPQGFVYRMCSAHFIQVRLHSFNPLILLGIQCF
jgi:hypothetical protein